EGLKTKVNANIGTSGVQGALEIELAKLDVAVKAGAHSVMDLSTGRDLCITRRAILDRSPVMVGAVPLYAVAADLVDAGREIESMTASMLLESIAAQCAEGIDYITVHCGVTRRAVAQTHAQDRVAGIVSRGGALLAAWMERNNRENPLLEEFDHLLDIAFQYDVTLSLGDGLRPGAVSDATDSAQIHELLVIGELAKRARNRGVQVMIEGPGHMPLDQIAGNVMLQKRICDGAPFYVLGPLTTDIAPGYDHITAAIGGAAAAAAGADFLCYVTPAEHLCLPNLGDVHQGVVSTLIAAHSGDIAKGVPGAMDRDRLMSVYRKELDWEGMFSTALDQELPRRRWEENRAREGKTCTMCGKLCALQAHNTLRQAGCAS
ncbi:MAG: phosphomethylpyrimidine synthase ThiC, partial [Desulfovibrionales bacterium]|nr:phosphomethylpyrimidine synthase ThiC [Desulfovibrionales bacterium]